MDPREFHMKIPFVTVAAAGGGISTSGLLTLVFVVLKITETITWSWWWVLSPLLASVGLSILCAVAFAFFALALMKD